MAKKSLIQREQKRKKLEEKYRLIRQSLKKKRKGSSLNPKKIKEIQRKLQSPTTPKANYRDFGLSGHILREMIHACLLPGATKSSW
ncbi:hypothetical protein LUZ62_003145 [Rhynchospora pubera]|uniref:30S ribosomal protein S14, chloroplastic n=1 Tax=Rhynchospora pubera TaxID=906938 RepID=A0AAV8BCD9_9POAL|nr:hypothetical protein LUZ62_003145 [Rhynchospora pubera]